MTKGHLVNFIVRQAFHLLPQENLHFVTDRTPDRLENNFDLLKLVGNLRKLSK